MKLLVVATLLSIALANTLFLRSPGLAKPTVEDSPSCITDYYTAFFAFFGLGKPNQILNCFGEKEAALYFTKIYEVANLVQDAESRNKVNVHLDWAKLIAIHKALEGVESCMAATQDFTDLLNALGIEKRDPELFMLSKYIYYQGNMGKLAGELPPVVDALNNKDFSGAGNSMAGVLNTTVSDIKTQGLALVALDGLWNGVHIGLDLPDAQSVLECWNNDTATVRLEFIYGMSCAVADGKWNDAATNTEKWYESTGNALIAKIPQSAWDCWGNSTDTKAESDKLKIDITSQEFYQKVSDFVHSHQLAYWGLQKAIKSNLEDHNFLHAGSAYARLLQAAVACK